MGGGLSRKATARRVVVAQSGLKEPTKLQSTDKNTTRDWNAEFQGGLDRVLAEEDFLRGYSIISNVVQDFYDVASRFTKVLVSELGILDSEKTFKAGLSNDQRFTFYEIQNIVFKIAHGGQGTDSWMELGNEFRHSMNIHRCHELGVSVPLMCIFDYKGFRTLAYARLPKFESLSLGWDPRQSGFVSDNPLLTDQLSRVAKLLNLSRHLIGTGDNKVWTYLNAGACANAVGTIYVEGVSHGKRHYITNLKDLMPTDLSLGGTVGVDEPADDVHCEAPLKLRPEFVRRYNKPLCADIPLPPPRARPAARYLHDNADESLLEVKRAIRILHRMVPTDTIDSLVRVLKEAEPEHAAAAAASAASAAAAAAGGGGESESHRPRQVRAQQTAELLRRVSAQVQGEGLNLRYLGLLRGRISPHTHDPAQQELRRLLLLEMAARLIKSSFHKVLREANGFGGRRHGLLQEVVAALVGPEAPDALKTTFEGRRGGGAAAGAGAGAGAGPAAAAAAEAAAGRRPPSDEACRQAVARFCNVVFSRPYARPRAAALRDELVAEGVEEGKAAEAETLARLIADMKRLNRENHPTGVDATLRELRREFVLTVKATIPGAEWALRRMEQRRGGAGGEGHHADGGGGAADAGKAAAGAAGGRHQPPQGPGERGAHHLHRGRGAEAHSAEELARLLLREEVRTDSFSVYWRDTMRALIVAKFGASALSEEEREGGARGRPLVEPQDLGVLLLRAEHLSGIRFARSAHRRLETIGVEPSAPGAVVRWVESEVLELGPSRKDMGLLLGARGWQHVYTARGVPAGPVRLQLLLLAEEALRERRAAAPNDWMASHDHGSVLYEMAWASPVMQRYERLREAYRAFRHSHRTCWAWLPSMLRLGDTVYAMTLLRQDAKVEEDYVTLCVEGAELLDHSEDYILRCGLWADQVYRAATMSSGFRAQRLYTLSGVTYNEWIGLGQRGDAAAFAWILAQREELGMEPADLADMIQLARSTFRSVTRLVSAGGGDEDEEEEEDAEFETVTEPSFDRVAFHNPDVGDGVLLLVGSKAQPGEMEHLELGNLRRISGDALCAVCEEHGPHLSSLSVGPSPALRWEQILEAIGMCNAGGVGRLKTLSLEGVQGLRDENAARLAECVPTTLTSLSLRGNLSVRRAVIDVVRRCGELRELDLTGCDRIDEEAGLNIVHCCPYLEVLRLAQCRGITDSVINELAFRTRRHYTGAPGKAGELAYAHDEPTLYLVNIILKHQAEKRERRRERDVDDDEDFDFGDLENDDDPEATKMFQDSQRRRRRLRELKQIAWQNELAKATLMANMQASAESFKRGTSRDGVNRTQRSPKRDDANETTGGLKLGAFGLGGDNDEPLTLEEISVKLGLEDAASREKRLQAIEKAAELKRRTANDTEALERFKQGKPTAAVAKELGMDINDCQKLRDKWELSRKEFKELRSLEPAEYKDYVPVFKITEVKVKHGLVSEIPPSTRLFMKVQAVSGGAIKSSIYSQPRTQMKFNLESFVPKLVDLSAFRVDLCEKPDTGPSKSLAYYKVPLPKLIDYAPEVRAYPLFGAALGQFQGLPVGKFYMDLRILSQPTFQRWQEAMQNYEGETDRKKPTKEDRTKQLDRAGRVCDRVFERVLNWALEDMLDVFAPYKRMRVLDLGGCHRLTDYSIIEAVRSFAGLEELVLSGILALTDEALSYIGHLVPSLRRLEIAGAHRVTDSGIVEVADGCLRLQELVLDECGLLTDAAISFVVQNDSAGRLTRLSFLGLPLTTEEALTNITVSSTSLRSLGIAGTPKHSDSQALLLAGRHSALTKLDLAWCSGLTSVGAAHIARRCTLLTDLSLAYCECVGTEGVMAVAECCPALTALDLTACVLVEDTAVQAAMRALLRLSRLSLSLCDRLTEASLAALADWGEGLTTLEILGCSSMPRRDVARFKARVAAHINVVDDKDDDFSRLPPEREAPGAAPAAAAAAAPPQGLGAGGRGRGAPGTHG